MRRSIFIITLILSSVLAEGFTFFADSNDLKIYTESKLLRKIETNDGFVPSLDIISGKYVLIASSHQLFVSDRDTFKAIGQKQTSTVYSFATTNDGILLVIVENFCCTFDSTGRLRKRFKLPEKGMGISSGKDVMYMFERNVNTIHGALYSISKSGEYKKMFEIPKPIHSVAEMKDSIIFASSSALFCFDQKKKRITPIIILPKGNEIESIAVDSASDRIYFSTATTIYSVKDSKAEKITDQAGGVLKYYNKRLIIFDPEKKNLISIAGLESLFAMPRETRSAMKPQVQTVSARAQPSPNTDSLLPAENKIANSSPPTLTNASVINMVTNNLSDELIIKLIKNSKVNFNISLDSVTFLSTNKVSAIVITEMKNAMGIKSPPAVNSSQENTKQSTNEYAAQTEKKEEIGFRDLPDAITDFTFNIKKSYRITSPENVVTYEVHHMTRDAEVVDFFDAKGKFLRTGQ